MYARPLACSDKMVCTQFFPWSLLIRTITNPGNDHQRVNHRWILKSGSKEMSLSREIGYQQDVLYPRTQQKEVTQAWCFPITTPITEGIRSRLISPWIKRRSLWPHQVSRWLWQGELFGSPTKNKRPMGTSCFLTEREAPLSHLELLGQRQGRWRDPPPGGLV